MRSARVSTLLDTGVVLAIAVDVGLIRQAGPLLAGVGVLLVIIGLIGLMPDLRYQLEASGPSSSP